MSEWVIIIKNQMNNYADISWYVAKMMMPMMTPASYYINTMSWIFIKLAHCKNSLRLGMPLHSET